MTVSQETETTILRLFQVEKWHVGTIASHLDIHHSVVERVLGLDHSKDLSKDNEKPHSIADPFIPFLKESLQTYPDIPAARLFHMVKERGYPGVNQGHFRRIVRRLRPRKQAEAFLRRLTLPAEEAQVDWGHFGHMTLGKARRPLMAFVMVLSYSRLVFLQFFVSQKLSCFLQGHVAAFSHLGGVPRKLLYDNPKTLVLERFGDAVRFHPHLLQCAQHYRFEPRPVAVARGNEKGRVERAIRYIRDSFWPARSFKDLDDINAQALSWCIGTAAKRPWPQDRSLSVDEAFLKERPLLLPLPEDPFFAEDRALVQAGKTPYVRYDLNDYTIPHDRIRRPLTVLASQTLVRIVDGHEVIATHRRSYDKGAQVEDPLHLEALAKQKAKARQSRGMDRLRTAVPPSYDLLLAAAERGYHLGTITQAMLRLLDQYGAEQLEVAVIEAIKAKAPHPHSVRQVLERNRQAKGEPAPLAVSLPNDPRVQAIVVRPHSLSDYHFDLEQRHEPANDQ